MLKQLIFSYFATIAFAYTFNAPKKSFFTIGAIGSIGWMLYFYFHNMHSAAVFGSFLGALAVAILSEVAARRYKMPATVFSIPAIIPMVPGTGMYYTMLSLVRKNYNDAGRIGIETMFIAGSIAMAIAIGSSLFKRRKKAS